MPRGAAGKGGVYEWFAYGLSRVGAELEPALRDDLSLGEEGKRLLKNMTDGKQRRLLKRSKLTAQDIIS